jgi:hypothetical protein
MPPMYSPWFAVISAALLAATAGAATRPHYGGTLRVEIRESNETADPPQAGVTLAQLESAFHISEWNPPRRAVYTARENPQGGRPFLDSIEIVMGRPLREQSIDLEQRRADIVELGPNELRRAPAGRRSWSSSPVRVIALVFAKRIGDARVREAVALSVNRAAIHAVLLQRQGEVSGALLPEWLSGHAFLFSTATDLTRARSLVGEIPPASRSLSIAAEDRLMADRIAVNARDIGLTLVTASGDPDLRLVEVRIVSEDPAAALAGIAAALGLPEPGRAESPEALYNAERGLLEGFRVIPLFHVPDVYGIGPRVNGGPGITPLGQWRFQNLWVDAGRP